MWMAINSALLIALWTFFFHIWLPVTSRHLEQLFHKLFSFNSVYLEKQAFPNNPTVCDGLLLSKNKNKQEYGKWKGVVWKRESVLQGKYFSLLAARGRSVYLLAFFFFF